MKIYTSVGDALVVRVLLLCVIYVVWYVLALLSHQKSRMDKLTEDLGMAENRLAQLKNEVTGLESHVIERKRQKSSVFPSVCNMGQNVGYMHNK